VHAPDATPEPARGPAADAGADEENAAAGDAYALPEPDREVAAADDAGLLGAAGGDGTGAEDAGDDRLAEVFGGAPDAETLARRIRRHVVQRYPIDGEEVFAQLDLRVRQAPDRAVVVAALVRLARDADLPRTARWAAETLPRLYR
jgi:hypothetical protein